MSPTPTPLMHRQQYQSEESDPGSYHNGLDPQHCAHVSIQLIYLTS
jgi:hypothetical protein